MNVIKQINSNTQMLIANCYDFKFDQQHLQDEFNFLIATKIVRNLKNKGLISDEEFNLIMLENKHTFPTLYLNYLREKVMKTITKIESLNAQIKKIMRVCAYCRVSTDSEEHLLSLKTQKTHYEDYIKANHEWEFAGLYFDEGISGTKKEKRPSLNKMLMDCENGKIDFMSPSR